MTKMLEIALSVARGLGLPVFPCVEKCDTKGKVSKQPYTRNGFKAATRDEAQIRKWWTQFPNAMIGVPTGKNTGPVAIDIDQSEDKNGEGSFAKLGIDDPETCQTLTVSGGRHIIFKYPDGHRLRNSVSGKLGQHIDIRGEGGYVIWAGSRTPNGTYAYRKGYSPEEVGFSEIPEILLNILLNKTGKKYRAQNDFVTIQNGSRNNTLFREGVSLVNAGVSTQNVRNHLKARANNCVDRLDIEELNRIQESALKYRKSSLIQLTDLGNGERFARDHAENVIFCSDQKSWYVWNNTYWAENEQKVRQLAKQTTRNMPKEAANSPEMLQRIMSWEKKTEAMPRQHAMLQAASFEPKIAHPFSIFNKDENLFNLQNGTFDLISQTFRTHEKTDHIIRIANGSFLRKAKHNRWLRFIEEVTDNDTEIANFLKKFCGYLLTGNRNEQIILFLVGKGANGKSVFLSVLKHIFGLYAGVINSKALFDRSSSAIPSDIAGLANKRFVLMSEFPENLPLNTATVKSITGGDVISARHLYQNWFDFKPQFQLVCGVNALPKPDRVDDAYFRRVRILPFQRIFQQKEMDKNLEQKLKAETDGIITWMIEGYQKYKAEGLEPTEKMIALLNDYRGNQDPVKQFLETTISNSEKGTFLPLFEIIKELNNFCYRQGYTIPTENDVKRRLREILGPSTQQRYGSNGERYRGYKGLQFHHLREDNYPF